MKRILSMILIVLLTLCLVACKGTDEPEEIYYEVSFSTTSLPYEAIPPATISVKKGDKVPCPSLAASPSAGYDVVWTKVQKQGSVDAYDFDAPVESSFTLYAVEVPHTYEVRYLLRNCANHPENPTSFTMFTDTITLLAPDPDYGYAFVRWSYYDDPQSIVTEIPKGTAKDVVLRAVLKERSYRILYYGYGSEDANPHPKTYTFGSTIDFKALESPTKEGYRFVGYTIYNDPKRTPVEKLTAEFVLEYDAALFKETGSDIALLANWEKVS